MKTKIYDKYIINCSWKILIGKRIILTVFVLPKFYHTDVLATSKFVSCEIHFLYSPNVYNNIMIVHNE